MDLDLVFVHKKPQRWERGNLFPPVRSICPVCPVRPVRSVRSGTVVVLPAAAFVLYTQLNILFCQGLWRLSLLACDMLSRLSLSEEKEKLFLNWTEPFPELSFCPVRLKLVFFRCFGLRILVWDLALVCLLLMLFGFFPRSLFYPCLPDSETLKAVFKIKMETDLPIKCLCSLLPLSLHLLQPIHVEASSYRRRFWAARQVPGWLRDPTLIVWRILEEEPI